MPTAVFQEWLNENSLRAYPFAENMQRLPVTDTGTTIPDSGMPNSIIVDFVLTVPGPDQPLVYLSQMGLIGSLLSFVFRAAGGGQIAAVTVDTASHDPYEAYDLIGTGDYPDARGRLVLGDLRRLSSDLADGLYTYPVTQTQFEPCTVRPGLRGVRSMRVSYEDSLTDYVYGHIKLVAGSNIQLAYDAAENAITISAIEAAGFTEECECEDLGEENVVRTINGIPVEDAFIVGDGACVEVGASGNQITIKDLCSEPCCGCPELELLTESLKVLDRSLQTVEGFSQQLATRIQTFVTNFTLSLV